MVHLVVVRTLELLHHPDDDPTKAESKHKHCDEHRHNCSVLVGCPSSKLLITTNLRLRDSDQNIFDFDASEQVKAQATQLLKGLVKE